MKQIFYLLIFISVIWTVHCQTRRKRQASTASERGHAAGFALGQALGGTVNNLLGGLLGVGNNGCNVNNGGCQQGCIVKQSRIHCYCIFGFVLNRDQRTCSQQALSCSSNNGGCDQECRVKGNGQMYCKCSKGFVLAEDKKSCFDVDECSKGNKCRVGNTCVNTIGGYKCALNGIDSCSVKNGGCDHTCQETKRGIVCRCNKGFQLHKNGRSCLAPISMPKPTDPCKVNNGGCDQICLNDGNSVKCECRDGFLLANGKCTESREAGRPSPLKRGCGINMKKTLFRRIVGGKPADPKDWPWMAAILRKSGSQFCGGVLITDRHVLTAAHCVVQFTKNDIKVRLGEYNFDTPDENSPTDFGVEEIRSHESYNRETQENDIAIIKLDKASSFSDFIWPACLPPANNKFENQLGFVTGWGTIEFGGPVSNVLLEVVLPVWKQSECAAAYPENKVTENMMCAGLKEGGKDSCQGDSGGPFLIQIQPNPRWYVGGIVSWGIQCASANRPGVYTRVNKYLDWIKRNAIF